MIQFAPLSAPRGRAGPHPQPDETVTPQIEGCRAKKGGEGEEGADDASQRFHVPPAPPPSPRTYRNPPPVILHTVLNWPYWWDLFAQKGRHLDWNYQRPRPPCLSLPEMLLPAKLLNGVLGDWRETSVWCLKGSVGGAFPLCALQNTSATTGLNVMLIRCHVELRSIACHAN